MTRPSALPPIDDVELLVTTRRAWHALTEHVLAPARYRAEKRIGLQASPGGFGTPVFGEREQLRVEGRQLVLTHGTKESRVPITTVGEAAAAAGIAPGAPSDVYPPATPLQPDAPLEVDDSAAAVLAAFFALGTELLEGLRVASAETDAASTVQLWPEHFDLGLELGEEDRGARATYGASPGDDPHDEPYLYVLWWTEPDPAFPGASRSYSELQAASDPASAGREFLERGRDLLARSRKR